MPFTIVRQDITKMKVDAIVNAANTELQMGGGVCGAIFRAAGAKELQEACDKLAPIKTGEAVITPGFNLPAHYIIHAVGPIYQEWSQAESEQLLRAAYTNALKRSVENHCKSIAFPLISSGVYGYPKAEALAVATLAIRQFLEDHELDVTLVVYDKASFSTSKELMGDVESYIAENYVETEESYGAERSDINLLRSETRHLAALPDLTEPYESMVAESAPMYSQLDARLGEMIDNLDEPFSQLLLRIIDAKGMTDVEVYKRANLDRRLFSKIRTSKGYMPSKRTALAFAVALELSLDETCSLLERAGFALSHAVKFDVIVEFFIINKKYDVYAINEVLFAYDQPLLGS